MYSRLILLAIAKSRIYAGSNRGYPPLAR